jgi:hypothetical protein
MRVLRVIEYTGDEDSIRWQMKKNHIQDRGEFSMNGVKMEDLGATVDIINAHGEGDCITYREWLEKGLQEGEKHVEEEK